MSSAPKTLTWLVLLVVAALAPGCGGNKADGDPEMARRKAELGQIYEVYSLYVKRSQRPPQQLSDLNQQDLQASYPSGLQALQKGDYVAVWGVNVGDKESGTVLAYQKDAPKQGGVVLMADGAVKNMSADQLQAALKGKG